MLKTRKIRVSQIIPEKLFHKESTVKILKIGTPEIITIIVLQLEQLDFTVQYCVQECRQNNKQRRP